MNHRLVQRKHPYIGAILMVIGDPRQAEIFRKGFAIQLRRMGVDVEKLVTEIGLVMP